MPVDLVGQRDDQADLALAFVQPEDITSEIRYYEINDQLTLSASVPNAESAAPRSLVWRRETVHSRYSSLPRTISLDFYESSRGHGHSCVRRGTGNGD